MTFLEIMQRVAKNAGIDIPATTASTDPDRIKIALFINETGKELARRVDWRSLRKTVTLTGDGTSNSHTIAADFARLPEGMAVRCDGTPVRGSLTTEEWFSLEPVEGSPRYFFLDSRNIGFYPYLPSGKQVTVQYQSARWVTEPGTQGFEEMTNDAQDTPLNGDLIAFGAYVRWRRHIGKDFADHQAEFEAMLADIAKAEGGVRAP